MVETYDPVAFEAVPRPVISRGHEYPASFEMATHQHRRGQLLYAAAGTVAVTTPEGAWIATRARRVDTWWHATFGAHGR